jgi:hypothetical protein
MTRNLQRTLLGCGVVVLVVSLGLNVWAALMISRLTEAIDKVKAAAASRAAVLEGLLAELSGEVDRLKSPPWVSRLSETMDAEGYEPGGPVRVTLAWALLELDPGAEVRVVYMPADDPAAGREVRAQGVGGLSFTVTLELPPETDWQYQIVGVVGGVRRASAVRQLDLRSRLGPGKLAVRRTVATGQALVYEVRQEPVPLLAAHRVTAVRASYRTRDGVAHLVQVYREDDEAPGGDETGALRWGLYVGTGQPGELTLEVTFGEDLTRTFTLGSDLDGTVVLEAGGG